MPSENPENRGKLTHPEKRILAQVACDEAKYNPFTELIDMATDMEEVEVSGDLIKIHSASTDQRISIAKEIASYLAPKVRTLDTGKTGPSTFNITINKFGDNPIEEAIDVNVTKIA